MQGTSIVQLSICTYNILNPVVRFSYSGTVYIQSILYDGLRTMGLRPSYVDIYGSSNYVTLTLSVHKNIMLFFLVQ